MYSVSDALKRKVIGSHERRARVTVLDSNLRPVAGGKVSADTVNGGRLYVSSGSGARRNIRISLNNADGVYTPSQPDDLFYWNKLVKVEQGIVLEGGDPASTEWVPVGVFMIDRPGVNVAKGGITMLNIRARDRWKLIDKAQFSTPGTYTSGTDVQDVLEQAAEYAGVPSAQIIKGGTTRTLGVDRHYEEGDAVGEFMTDLARAFGLRVYFDVSGYLVIDDQPLVDALPVAHHYRPGVDSIVTDINRDLTDERFANHIVVTRASSELTDPVDVIRAEAEDNRANSPTSVDAANGGVGRRTRRYSSPMITDATVAQDVADKLLQRYLRFSEETSLRAVGLPYLDADDRVFVSHPNAGLSANPYLVESVDMPILGAESSLRLTAAHDL